NFKQLEHNLPFFSKLFKIIKKSEDCFKLFSLSESLNQSTKNQLTNWSQVSSSDSPALINPTSNPCLTNSNAFSLVFFIPSSQRFLIDFLNSSVVNLPDAVCSSSFLQS